MKFSTLKIWHQISFNILKLPPNNAEVFSYTISFVLKPILTLFNYIGPYSEFIMEYCLLGKRFSIKVTWQLFHYRMNIVNLTGEFLNFIQLGTTANWHTVSRSTYISRLTYNSQLTYTPCMSIKILYVNRDPMSIGINDLPLQHIITRNNQTLDVSFYVTQWWTILGQISKYWHFFFKQLLFDAL